MSSQYLLQIEQLVGQKGSLAEKQLIQRWRSELDQFLAPATRQLLNQNLSLEIGLEDTLTLKINLKPRGMGAVTTLLAMMEASPTLAPWVKYVLDHQLRFICGIKLSPERCSHEIYLYPRDHEALARQLPSNSFSRALCEIKPLGVGIDDHRGKSMYFRCHDTHWIDTLQHEIGLTNWHGASIDAWQQIRFDGESLLPGKTAIQITPLPLPVLTRLISHYPVPFFRYLVPLKHQREGNFGRDPVTGRFAIYATVN